MSSFEMTPATGDRVQRFVGDRIRIALKPSGGDALPKGWQARLRTNLGRAEQQREEIIQSHFQKIPLAGVSWRDIPMEESNGEWFVHLPLTQVGFFQAKAYAIDDDNRQHWPGGDDLGISVNPDHCRGGNTIYCAFPRMFGKTKSRASTKDKDADATIKALDKDGYTVIPPSGTLRDLKAQLPHILDALGCRILLLLPVNPTPTVMARFGRYGSPYACQDLTAIDPALVEFDKRTTGVDQFCELASAVHAKGAKLFIDLVINHTGWGSTLHEERPEWFRRQSDGEFESPGAWGIVWEDLVELDQRFPELWDELAEVFLTWCRRGVDGFRCDAGYKVPTHVWQYITAKVRREYPDAVFLLEGLGGSWEATDSLLTDGGMQWAYSELFQEYTGENVARYLDHALSQSERIGTYVHFSETHDNLRLAAQGRDWSLLRNRLCGLTSVCGGFGFANGVEWLAAEQINVHSSRGMSWGDDRNIISELKALNELINGHPCFFDGAKLERISPPDAPIYALHRTSAEGADSVLVLANCDMESEARISLPLADFAVETTTDLLNQPPPNSVALADGKIAFTLAPGACFCLSQSIEPKGLSGDDYRRLRAQSAFAIRTINHRVTLDKFGEYDWQELASVFAEDPENFLGSIGHLNPDTARQNLAAELRRVLDRPDYPFVVTWRPKDRNKITLVPAFHFLLIEGGSIPFQAQLNFQDEHPPITVESIPVGDRFIAAFTAASGNVSAELTVKPRSPKADAVSAQVRFINSRDQACAPKESVCATDIALLTNGRGAMARMCADLGRVTSKYDCVLGANLHSSLPIDRHIFVKRMRVWINADGFIAPLNGDNLKSFESDDNKARWQFIAGAGDGRAVDIKLTATMPPNENTVALEFTRSAVPTSIGRNLPSNCKVSLTVRLDIEDRNFHTQTKRSDAAEHHFGAHTANRDHGFVFKPAPDRILSVETEFGAFHAEPEWSENIPHPVEQTRGQEGAGDSYSPGWFEIPIAMDQRTAITVTAEPDTADKVAQNERPAKTQPRESSDAFRERLERAVEAFVVRRDDGKTVIAGYPWFLDWGRDTLIAARGLLNAGMRDTVEEILLTFGRYEENGTLPNTIHGSDVSNRDTSDAPLWYGVICSGFAHEDPGIYKRNVGDSKRTIQDVLRSIAVNYAQGTPNGIHMDPQSGLIWSPSHFTWMDTNHPAGTPRAGYPVEIQALWILLLQQLHEIGAPPLDKPWMKLAAQAQDSFDKLFWLEDKGWFADLLIGDAKTPAADCIADNALRSNCLFAISLGLADGEKARRCVEAARRYLIVPGALRSLAPLPVSPPLPIHGADGQPLNDPTNPYWGRYEGDEDTRRKPAYHNGTAWTWTFPTFCEALVRAYGDSREAADASRDYLFTMVQLMNQGCLGQIPEILDGDAPHAQRGCDAQAWGATEALRVWLMAHWNEKD
jgi:predicted glycogen debranching enzyme